MGIRAGDGRGYGVGVHPALVLVAHQCVERDLRDGDGFGDLRWAALCSLPSDGVAAVRGNGAHYDGAHHGGVDHRHAAYGAGEERSAALVLSQGAAADHRMEAGGGASYRSATHTRPGQQSWVMGA